MIEFIMTFIMIFFVVIPWNILTFYLMYVINKWSSKILKKDINDYYHWEWEKKFVAWMEKPRKFMWDK